MSSARELRTGAKVPSVGLGTWKMAGSVSDSVKSAIELGWRHLDCACDYGNEVEVGKGIKAALDAGLCKREELWVTSKLWNTYHAKEHVRPACEKTLSDLGLDYLDLYLIHFPISLKYVPFDERYPPEWAFDPAKGVSEFANVPIRETWEAMEGLVEAGLVKNIGVCNFSASLLMDLFATDPKIPPAVNQIELHPYNSQQKLLDYCATKQIHVTGFSPLGSSSYIELNMDKGENTGVLEHPAILKIAETHGRSAAQVCLRWGIQRGTTVIPKTSTTARLKENLDVFGFELSAAEMKAIDDLNRNCRYNDPGEFCNPPYPIYA